MFKCFIIAIILCGCALTKKNISYNLDDINKSPSDSLKNISLNIQCFADGRKKVKNNLIYFYAKSKAYKDGSECCINSEENYKSDSVAIKISSLIADHLRKRNAFKSVSFNSRDSSDYCISGNIRQFAGTQLIAEHEQNAFGIMNQSIKTRDSLIKVPPFPGPIKNNYEGLSSMPDTIFLFLHDFSYCEIFIEFNKLKLVSGDGKTDIKLPAFKYEFKGDLPFYPEALNKCSTIYDHMNSQLKSAVDRFCADLEKEILAK